MSRASSTNPKKHIRDVMSFENVPLIYSLLTFILDIKESYGDTGSTHN